MRGINYGHHWSAASYDQARARQEMKKLLESGFTVIRIVYPTFNSSTATLNLCHDLVELALSLPFEKIIWGAVGARPSFSATQHEAHKSYLTTNLAPYAQSLNDSRLQISVGNEEEMWVNTASLSITDLQSSLKSAMVACKNIYTIGTVDYCTASTYQLQWYNLGLPSGCKLGMNLYYEYSPVGTFKISATSMASRFGSDAYVSEYSTEAGFNDALVYGGSKPEQNWSDNLALRTKILESLLPADVPIIFFCYKDGSFGVPMNRFALELSDGVHRTAWSVLTHDRTIHARPSSIKSHGNRSY